MFYTYRRSTLTKKLPLSFRQLKEYINSQRHFNLERNDISMQNKTFNNKYYLIDKNWLEKWKESINFKKFYEHVQNRFVTDEDYKLFIQCVPGGDNLKFFLNNSDVYYSNGNIKYESKFIIVNKKCY